MSATNPTRCILVVDDDRAWSALLMEFLRRAGYEASAAENADEALAAVAAGLPDLAVLDIRMPGLSGLELGTILRDQFGVPYIFLSLVDDEPTVRQATAMGALAYLVKPNDARQCIPTIEAALARAEELRRLRESESHLSNALQQNREISTAVGLLMERLRVDRNSAFERLRDEARARRQRVSEVAAGLLESAEHLNSFGPAAAQRTRRAQ